MNKLDFKELYKLFCSNRLRRCARYIFCFNLLVQFATLYPQIYVGFNFQEGIWIEEEFVKDNYTKFSISGHLKPTDF